MITKSIFNYLVIKDVRLKEFDVLKYGFRESITFLILSCYGPAPANTKRVINFKDANFLCKTKTSLRKGWSLL